ncbi:hypothetical protein [Saccharicrinis sp. GN24d3]|uniref:hypothetical protein n=1 Tax=Saccharicrinis sp. GN24d3 TaxID=3458416 RepID=UPI00403572D3
MKYELDNYQEVIKNAVHGDGAALAKIDAHLKNWVKHAGIDHARIEKQQLCIWALGYGNRQQVDALDVLMQEMINQKEL